MEHLRNRVESAANEIERLRTENAALAQRVLELQNGRAELESAHTFGEGEDAATLRARIEGFIRSIDEILEIPETEHGADSQETHE